MIVISLGYGISPGEDFGSARLSKKKEEEVVGLKNRLAKDREVKEIAEAIASAIASDAPPAMGVIISPGVPPWAIRAVSTALEEKGFIPLAYLDDKEEVVRV